MERDHPNCNFKSRILTFFYSIAKCLGAKTVCDRALECARKYKVISVVVDDREAVQAIEMFLGMFEVDSDFTFINSPVKLFV